MNLKSMMCIIALLPGVTIAGEPVNINKASVIDLARSLDGVGVSRAQAIVDYRSIHGPFESAMELTQVKGIGMATLKQNQQYILLDDNIEDTNSSVVVN